MSIALLHLIPWQASLLTAQGATSPDSSQTYVAVSRREMRVFFAPETSSVWGWSVPTDTTRRRSYSWSVAVEGLDGPRSLSLQVERPNNLGRTFPSLESLVRAGTTKLCQPGMMVQCFDATVAATVENRRVVLTYRDSAAIARMFGQRPVSVTTLEDAPAMREPYRLGQASVRYVDPQLPQLDSSGRRSAAQARRAYEASVNLVRRRISVETGGGALSLAVGDSAQLGVEEWHCLEDSCTPFHDSTNAPRDWGRWSLSDSSVARLYRLGRPAKNWRFAADSERVMTLVALKTGRTIVRAVGVHTAADSVPSRRPVDSILETEVVVTPAIGRLMITPRPATMSVGEETVFSVKVLDRSGKAIEGAPVELMWGVKGAHTAAIAAEPVTVSFPRPGHYEIIATLGVHADTVNLDVTPPARRP